MRATVDYVQVYRAQHAVRLLASMSVPSVEKVALNRFGRHLQYALDDIDSERKEILAQRADCADEQNLIFHGDTPEEKKASEQLANREFLVLQRGAKVSIECIEASVLGKIEGEGVVALMLELGDLLFDPEDSAELRPKRVES